MSQSLQRSQRVAPYLFLSPYVLLTIVFFLYPLAYAVLLAFHQTNGPMSWRFVGLKNFSYIFTDPAFHRAILNTAVYAVFSICLQLPLSLALAMLLNSGTGRTKAFFRLAIFAPNLVGPVFVGILFGVLFAPNIGLFNQLVHAVFGWITHLPGGSGEGFIQHKWLADPQLIMPALVIVSLWLYTGFNMIYFLAALQGVDKSLVEASIIDGATPVQTFRYVTLPAIMPVVTFVVVMSTIGSFNLFELPYTLLQGNGPDNAGLTIIGYMFSWVELGDLGTASAVGWALTIMILALSLIQLKITGATKKD
jgi:ABC-type sugar transport system permease subunit